MYLFLFLFVVIRGSVLSSPTWSYLECSESTVVRFPRGNPEPDCPLEGLFSIQCNARRVRDFFAPFSEMRHVDIVRKGDDVCVINHRFGPTLAELRFSSRDEWTWDRIGYYGARIIAMLMNFHDKGFTCKLTPDLIATHLDDATRLSAIPSIRALTPFKVGEEKREVRADFEQLRETLCFLFNGNERECPSQLAFLNFEGSIRPTDIRAQLVRLMKPTHAAHIQGRMEYLGHSWGAPRRDIFIAGEEKFLGCGSIGRGTEGYVVTAIRVPSGHEVPEHCDQGTVVVKCDSHQSLEREARLLESFRETRPQLLTRAHWVASKHDYYPLVPSRVCLVLQLFGPTLRDLRVSDGTKKWTWTQLGRLGARMVQMIAEFHRNGYYHRDFHPGNIVTDRRDVNIISPIDLGAMLPFTDHVDEVGASLRKIQLNERLTDLRQIVCNIRSLWDGSRTYYAEKRTSYAKVKAGLEVAGIPSAFKRIVDKIYTIDNAARIDYDALQNDFFKLK